MKKNMIILKGDLMYGEGSIKINECFFLGDGLMKLDLLHDWIAELNGMYQDAYLEWMDQLKKLRRENKKKEIK